MGVDGWMDSRYGSYLIQVIVQTAFENAKHANFYLDLVSTISPLFV